jgi:NADPH:quinone reductase-like Zn-dependent oxidoreductase
MRAVIFNEHGGPERLVVTTLPDPEPAPGQVVVALETAALNRLDLAIRNGIPGVRVALPHVPGCEGYGRIAALGAGVTGWSVGDPVVVTPGSSCLVCEACAAGEDSLCRDYRMIGYQEPGCYAEMVTARAWQLHPAGQVLTPEEWSAFPLVYLTVWRMLTTRARLKPGETVLVQAAGSGVGTAAIQVARVLGAQVIATTSGGKVERARALGVEHVIDYTTSDVGAEVKRLTGGALVDVVVDHAGASTWNGSLASLRRGGRLVTCGASDATPVSFDLRYLFVKQFELIGSYMGGRRELYEVMRLATRGAFRPVIDSIFPLEQAADAHRHLESRAAFGKVVLRIRG